MSVTSTAAIGNNTDIKLKSIAVSLQRCIAWIPKKTSLSLSSTEFLDGKIMEIFSFCMI